MILTSLGFCNLLRNPSNLTWLCTKASCNLLRSLLWNPVELDLAAPKPPRRSPEPCWTWPGSGPKPPRPSPEPSPEPCWTWPGPGPKPPRPSPEPSPELCWPGSAPKPPRPSPEPSSEPVEPDLALHQGFQELSPEACWAWHGSAPKPPRPAPEPSEPSPTSLNLTRRLRQCTPELFWLKTHWLTLLGTNQNSSCQTHI